MKVRTLGWRRSLLLAWAWVVAHWHGCWASDTTLDRLTVTFTVVAKGGYRETVADCESSTRLLPWPPCTQEHTPLPHATPPCSGPLHPQGSDTLCRHLFAISLTREALCPGEADGWGEGDGGGGGGVAAGSGGGSSGRREGPGERQPHGGRTGLDGNDWVLKLRAECCVTGDQLGWVNSSCVQRELYPRRCVQSAVLYCREAWPFPSVIKLGARRHLVESWAYLRDQLSLE